MKSDEKIDDFHVSGVDNEVSENKYQEESSDEVESSDEEGSKTNEVSESESITVVSYDYTSYLQNIQNSLTVNNAFLLGVLLFLAVTMGLRKHD